MSPELSPAARGAGQRVNDTAGGWKQWTCHECGRTGREIGTRAARDAFERHWIARHQEVEW